MCEQISLTYIAVISHGIKSSATQHRWREFKQTVLLAQGKASTFKIEIWELVPRGGGVIATQPQDKVWFGRLGLVGLVW